MQRRSSQRPHRGTAIVIACLITATMLVGGVLGAVALTDGQGGTPRAGDASASASPASSGAVLPSASASPSNRADRALDALRPVVSAAGFVHPGVFVNLAELKATRDHINAGDQPWTDLFHGLETSKFIRRGAPDFSAFAPATDPRVGAPACSTSNPAGCVSYCGSFNVPNVGCTQQQDDARAVYAQSLMYAYTGNATYAERAIAILNSYAAHFRGSFGSNGPLMTAWTAEQMIRGAEILRYTYTPSAGGPTFDVAQFSAMLRTTIIPTLRGPGYAGKNGNWGLSAADGLMNTAVFLDDRALFEQAVGMWRDDTRAYIYLSSDGSEPIPPASAFGKVSNPPLLACRWLSNKPSACLTHPQTDPHLVAQNGQNQESCRDFGHASMGLAAIVNGAETAWIQGTDLYREEQQRIITGYLYTVQISQNIAAQGWPQGFCDGAAEGGIDPSLQELAADVFYNAYAVRLGQRLSPIAIPGYPTPPAREDPVEAFIQAHRVGRDFAHNVTAWEALTHYHSSVSVPKKQ
ncbi:alginate lyase family protein [Microbacterium sp. GXS0129]|uniref:alginate lyase family protein n=1 Tax=Microbacterium sp. GXS0129 TaxID=3377836 RepID=UPI00383A7B04